MSDFRLAELLDLTSLQKMADSHYRAAGMPIGIIDAIDGSILVGSGWQDICVKFHRANPGSLQRCQESDNHIKDRLAEGKACHYKCMNGLWDIGMPIVVAGCHLATMFLGQFFYEGEAPDREFFIQLAHDVSYDVDDYLAALDRVPVFSREKVDYILEYDKALVSFISDLAENALSKIKTDVETRKEKALLRCIIDSVGDLIFFKDMNGVYQVCNKASEEFIGLPESEQIGKTDFDFFDRGQAELIRQDDLRVINGGKTVRAEEWVTNSNGHKVLMDTQKVPFYGPNGEIKGLVGISRDITERNQLLEALKLREHYQRALLDNFPFAVWLKDKEGHYLTVNRQLATYHGVQWPEELIGKTVFDVLPQAIAEGITEEDRKVLSSGRVKHTEEQLPVNGVNRWFDIYQSPIIIDSQIIGTVGCNWDIHERHEMEEALRDSRLRLEQIFEFLPDATFAIDMNGRVIAWNRVMEELTGISAANMLGKGDYEYSIAFYGKRRPLLADLVISGTEEYAEYTFLQKEGNKLIGETKGIFKPSGIHYFSGIAAPLFDSEGRIIGAIEHIRDITELRQAEERLKESEARYRVLSQEFQALLNCVPDGLTLLSPDLKILWANAISRHISGVRVEDQIGMHCYKLRFGFDLPCTSCLVSDTFTTGEPGSMIKALGIPPHERTVEFRYVPIKDDNGSVVKVFEVCRDITEHKKLEEDLRRAHKLDSIGVLAGGIAHDFNNLLTCIVGNISMTKLLMNPEDKGYAGLDKAEMAIKRASDLTQQLLTFSKGGAPIRKTASLEQIVIDSASFVLRGSNVRCEYTIPDAVWPAEVDEGQMNQVINNLIINADQAMPEGGIIKVCIENLTVRPDEIPTITAGRYVKISIEDHGTGISEGHLYKIFDPYFTTKQKGNGLGLATVYSIIKSHDGYIKVESKVGAGTTFHVFLPASNKEMPAANRTEEKLLSGSGKILIMDDDELIREVASGILVHFGYEVAVCSEGEEAIELYREAKQAGEPFAAVIMDLTIPGGTGGKETMKMLLDIDEKAVGIVSSGYCNDPILANYRDYGFLGVAAKPYSIEELGKVLHELLPQA